MTKTLKTGVMNRGFTAGAITSIGLSIVNIVVC